MSVGDSFTCNKNCFFACSEEISIGDRVKLGWEINIRDSDGHTIFYKGEKKPSIKKVYIGNHIWIASCVDVLKGTFIADNSVVGYRSVLTNKFEQPGCLIAGYPAKVVQTDIDWED